MRIAAIALAVLAGAGCGRNDLIAPQSGSSAVLSGAERMSVTSDAPVPAHPYTRGSYEQSLLAATCAPHTAVAASGVFGPAGGTLFFGDSRLIIPGGALRDTVTISASVPDGSTARVEFAPHGLQFNKPAGLILSTVGCVLADPNVPNVVYLSEDGLVLETIAAVFDPHWKTIAAPIQHFSGYAIAF